MQDIIRRRLNPSSSTESSSSARNSDGQRSLPNARQATPDRPEEHRRRQEAENVAPVAPQAAVAVEAETRSFYDLIIAAIVLVIAMLIFRRISLINEPPSTTSMPPSDN